MFCGRGSRENEGPSGECAAELWTLGGGGRLACKRLSGATSAWLLPVLFFKEGWLIALALGAGALVMVLTATLRTLCSRPLSGAEAMEGTVGVARTDLAPKGRVTVKGRVWGARALGEAIPRGSQVRVRSLSGLMLIVVPVEEMEQVAKGTTAIGTTRPKATQAFPSAGRKEVI